MQFRANLVAKKAEVGYDVITAARGSAERLHMVTENHIECPAWRRAFVPQLWVNSRNCLEHPRVMYLYPFCGVALHESGGGVDRGCWLSSGAQCSYVFSV